MRNGVFYVGYGVLLILFVVLYYKVLFYKPFIYDDPELILENSILQQKKWKEMFTQGYLGNYMPFFMVYITCLYHLGQSIFYIHFVSLLLHLINAVLLYYIFKNLRISDQAVFLSILFFLIHPIQTEATCWASEARTILGNFFLLLAMLPLSRQELSFRQMVLSDIFFVFSLLSKPTGVIYPLIFFFMRMNRPTRGFYANLIMTFFISAAFSVFTYFIQKEQGFVQESKYLPYAYRIPHAFFIYARYAWNTLFPFWLSILYPYSKHLKWMLLAGAGLMFVIPYVWWKLRNKNPNAFLMISLSAVVLLPVLQIVTFGQVPIADRYVYLFVPFFVAGISSSLEKHISERLWRGMVAFWSILLTVLTYNRIHLWSDSLLILQDADAKYPQSHIIYTSLGVEYMRRDMDELAEQYLNKAVRIAPLSPDLRYNLALYYIKKNQGQKAYQILSFSASKLAFHKKTFVLLAEFENLNGNYPKAISLVERSLKANPNQARGWFVLGNALSGMNRPEEAVKAYA
ncbi:MAG: hypothetical protein N3F09_07855, partial [Bacteroidia bacterium]|nr:hypothetical protein [Bacteroidia bacterium]